MQGLVDGTEPIEADSTEMRPQAVECMFLVLNVSAELSKPQLFPPNFRLATGVSKFTGESKPDTWLEDYRVAV